MSNTVTYRSSGIRYNCVNPDTQALFDRINAWCIRNRTSVVNLADRSGICFSTLHRAARRKSPLAPETVERIERVLAADIVPPLAPPPAAVQKFASTLNALMKLNRISNEDLARIVGVSTFSVHAWRTRRTTPCRMLQRAIVDYLENL